MLFVREPGDLRLGREPLAALELFADSILKRALLDVAGCTFQRAR